MINFGAETKLIASGEKYIGVISQSSSVQLQGKLTIEGSEDNEIIGINGTLKQLQPLTLQINSQYANTITGITGGNLLGQPIELQIDAPNSMVTAIKSGSISNEINITKFVAKKGSYIINANTSSIYETISVGNTPTTEEKQDFFAIYSDLNDAQYIFIQSSNFSNTKTRLIAKDNQKNYYGIFAKQNLSIGGNATIEGKSANNSTLKNVVGIYIYPTSNSPLSLSIQDDTNLTVIGHNNNYSSSASIGIVVNQTDATLNIEKTKKLALHFYTKKSDKSKYIGFYIKNASLNISNTYNEQNLIFDTLGDTTFSGNELAIFVLDNGSLQGNFDFYVNGNSASYAYTSNQMYGIYSKNQSLINSQIIFRDGFFKKSHPIDTVVPKMNFINNEGELTFGDKAIFYAEDLYENKDSTYLINNTGSIIFESGAKAIFGQEYAKLSEITQDGIYLAKDTGKITSASMSFKGNAGISVAGGATLNMTLSGGSLEFNGSNNDKEMIAFNALKSADPNVMQGKINLIIQNLNSSIIFTKAQGGQLENFTSRLSNPISSASTDKNTIVNLAGITQDNNLVREKEGKLATRSLTIQNANIKNVNFVAYINPNISTSDVTITNFDGRAYSDNQGAIASFGASDQIIINGGSSSKYETNTLSFALAPNQSTKNISGYMLVGKVKTDSGVVFNDLKDGKSQNITTYSGLRTTTLTLHRSDVGDYSYYYVTSAQDSITPPSGGGNTGGSSGGGSSGGGDSGSTGGGSTGGGSGNTGGSGETGGSDGGGSGGNSSGGGEITPPNNGNEGNSGNNGDTTPPSNPNIPVIDAPNVGVAPLTRSAFHANFTLMSSTLNSLNKRLGDIRSLEVSDGIWARVFVGEEVFKDALQTTALYTSIQAGYDHAMDIKGNTNFIGFALAWVGSDATSQEDSYQVSPIDFINGHNTTKTNGIELALYDSYLSSFGLYTDSILKFGYYSSDVSMPVMENFTLDNFSFSLSQEVGYQAKFGEKNEWLITPQAEVAYAYFSGSNATQNLLVVGLDNIMDISQDALNLLRMRFGIDWGYAFNGWSEIVSKADIHLGTSYEYDVISGGDMLYSLPNMGKVKEKGMQSNGRFVLNVGTNVYIKDAVSLYFDFEKSFGDVMYKNYQANLGVRYSFGEKIHAPQEASKDNTAPLSIPKEQTKENQEEK